MRYICIIEVIFYLYFTDKGMEKKNCCNENLELSESKDFLDFAVLKENLNILSSDNIMSDWILIFAILVAKS